MPNLDISFFHGTRTTTTSSGRIHMEGKGDSAALTFTDKSNHSITARLENFEVKNLKKNPLYKSSTPETQTEILLHEWHTRKSKNTIIKYAGKNQVAFVFTVTTDGALAKCFAHLQESELHTIEYLKELNFSKFIAAKFKINFEIFKSVPGISKQILKLFLAEAGAFRILLDHGVLLSQLVDEERFNLLANNLAELEKLLTLISIEKLHMVSNDRLQKYFSQTSHHQDVLEFLTIQQILGLDHVPLTIGGGTPTALPYATPTGNSSGPIGKNFSYEQDKNVVTVSHKDVEINAETKLKITFGSLKEEASKELEEVSKNTPTQDLIHTWRLCRTGSEIIKYCPQLKYTVVEEPDLKFPFQAFKEYQFSLLKSFALYHMEERFRDFLLKNNCPLERFKKLKGMTLKKMECLCLFFSSFEEVLKAGFKIEDIARVDEARLLHVIKGLAGERAQHALEFVNVYELLALSKPESSIFSFSFFSRRNEEKSAAPAIQESESKTARLVV
jgi:hypothetical protein